MPLSKPPKPSTIGSRIAAARKARSISASELARGAEVSPAAVWHWENDKATPAPGNLEKVAKVLMVSVAHLREGESLKGIRGDVAPPASAADDTHIDSILNEAKQKLATFLRVRADRVTLVYTLKSD